MTNWPQYDASLVRQGDLTVWLTEVAVTAWRAPKLMGRGGQHRDASTERRLIAAITQIPT